MSRKVTKKKALLEKYPVYVLKSVRIQIRGGEKYIRKEQFHFQGCMSERKIVSLTPLHLLSTSFTTFNIKVSLREYNTFLKMKPMAPNAFGFCLIGAPFDLLCSFISHLTFRP